MISYRHRGFVSMHHLGCLAAAMALLPGFASSLPWIPRLKLEEDVRLAPYLIAILVGMVWGQRGLFSGALDLHRLSWSEAFHLAAKQVCVVAVCIFTLMFAIKDRGISRLFLVVYLGLLWVLLIVLHAKFPAILARWLFSDRELTPTLLVGRVENAGVLNGWLTRRRHLGLAPVGMLLDVTPPETMNPLVPFLGTWDQLAEHLSKRQVSQVILLGWLDDAEAVERMVRLCEAAGCRFLIHNDYGARFARRFLAMQEGGHDFLAIQPEPLEDPINRALKRAIDLLVALPVVVCVLPPACVLVWFLQRRKAPGSLFFSLPRGGWRQSEFRMLKFRSMYSVSHDFNRQATAQDARVYPGGHWLRRTSMDELPQFWNVLKGDMSVVGPRPHLSQHDEVFSRLAPAYHVRSLIKPGITGLAQVKGYRGEITAPEKLHGRVYWDLYYARNWSPGLDLRIVARTVWQVFVPPKTAY